MQDGFAFAHASDEVLSVPSGPVLGKAEIVPTAGKRAKAGKFGVPAKSHRHFAAKLNKECVMPGGLAQFLGDRQKMNPPGRAAGGFHWQATPDVKPKWGSPRQSLDENLRSATIGIYRPAKNDIPYLGYVAVKIVKNDHTL